MLCVGCDGELVTPFLNLTEVLSECWEERGAVGQFCKHEGAFKARYEDLVASKPVSPEGPGQKQWPSAPSRLPRWLRGEDSACQRRRRGFNSWVGKIPW